MKYQPVIIIGAPRSGTNMLRNMLVDLPGIETWPCDEINYIWRHGNVRYPSDEFTPEMATHRVGRYIRNQFDRFASSGTPDIVLEKTCANSMRVGFVDHAIPDAKYIFIVRHGLDAVHSALMRMKASLDLNYVLKKAKYTPPTDLPYYAARYLSHHLHRVSTKEKALPVWGPVMDRAQELMKNHSTTEMCALQWKRCVDNSDRDFANLSDDRVIRVKYEDLVSQPVTEFEKIANFLGKDASDSYKEYLRLNVRTCSVGKGRKALGQEVVDEIRPLIADTLVRYGYE